MSLQLVGVDLETGGLNGYETLPSGERVHGAAYYPILEMAFFVCDEKLDEITHFTVGIWDESFLERMSPWAKETHTKSGLIDRLRGKTKERMLVFKSNEEAEAYAIEQLSIAGVTGYDRKAKTGAVMFGNSIGFDVSYIDAQMPSLKNFFHYRTIDVSSIDLLRQTAWAGLGLPKAEKQYAHTAMADIHETYYELVDYTDYLERPAANVLMSRDNPNGWKLEELLPKIAKEIAAKTVRIKGDESGRSLSIQKNNTEIEAFLHKAARKQFDTLRLLDEVGTDQGPKGEARI